MNIPLEDNFTDVIGKAQRGLEISDSDLAKQARLDASAIRKLRNFERYDDVDRERNSDEYVSSCGRGYNGKGDQANVAGCRCYD